MSMTMKNVLILVGGKTAAFESMSIQRNNVAQTEVEFVPPKDERPRAARRRSEQAKKRQDRKRLKAHARDIQ